MTGGEDRFELELGHPRNGAVPLNVGCPALPTIVDPGVTSRFLAMSDRFRAVIMFVINHRAFVGCG